VVSISALDQKLTRDLWRMRGQVLAVALVIASGVATLVMSLSTVEALQQTTDTYYQRYRFAEIFAQATRAPQRLLTQIESLPGVQTVQTRITRLANIDIDGFSEPVIGQINSIPQNAQPKLNQLVIRKGRWISPGRDDEVILSEPFAQAHQLGPGDPIKIIMNGHKRLFYVVGVALSPEFIYSIGPGALMPDDKRFGVMWMGQKVLEGAYDLEGSFNSLSLTLLYNTPPQKILKQLDVMLKPYGGTRAFTRGDQISNWFVQNEITQQKSMARILPTIFIAVAAFLSNMVLTRLITTQRTEIGLLKAFGYSSGQIGWHYSKMILLICILGVALGSVIGAYFGRINTQMYAELFRFPLLIYHPGPFAFIIGGLVSTLAAWLGALNAVRKAVKLPPAEAMIPPSPDAYRSTFISSTIIAKGLDQPSRIALRQIFRWPVRSFLTSSGIAMAAGLIILSLQWNDSLTHLSRVYFFEAQRQNAMVGVVEDQAIRAIHDFAHLPGVLAAEPMRMVSAEFKAGVITHRGAITALPQNSELHPIYDDAQRKVISLPASGLVIASRLAQKLQVKVGDMIWVEILQGRRPEIPIQIVGIFETYIGLPAYMHLEALNTLLSEPPSFRFANLLIDPNQQEELYLAFKNTPKISAVMLKQSAIDAFNENVIEHLMVFITMFTGLAVTLALGVTYNSARIALSERGRELATLRVLGFTKGEISYVLLGEVMFLTLLGLPLGALFGWGLVWSMAQSFDTEMYRIPLVIEPSTYGYAILWVLLASALSAILVRQRVAKLDLIRVLKTRE
jgi:putative ABC transport system permease protein